MSQWDAADCLARLRRTIGRPSVDEALPAADGYALLSTGQDRVNEELAAHCPWLNYGAPELMTTSDSGVTYTTLYDALGHMEVYPALTSLPLRPGAFWDGSADYALEGPGTIRMVGNRARTFADGPYARYVRANLPLISASQDPILKPSRARQLMILAAAIEWAGQGGRRDPTPYERQYVRAAWGDLATGTVGLIPAEKNKHFGQGSAAISESGGAWWRSSDLSGSGA